MRKHLAVLTALALLLTGLFMPAVQAEETSFVGSMMALSSMQSQVTPEQEQELNTIVDFLNAVAASIIYRRIDSSLLQTALF